MVRCVMSRWSRRSTGALLAGVALLLLVAGGGPALAVGIVVAVPFGQTERSRRLLTVALSMAGGAAIGGAAGYGIATVAAPAMMTTALGFGVAVGGAAGIVAMVLPGSDQQPRPAATVSTDTSESAGQTPKPQPADLFADHPDPAVYYDARGDDGPMVRAVNDRFEDVFGVEGSAMTNEPLADAPVAAGDDAVIEAASAGEAVDVTVEMDTARGSKRLRVRTVGVSDEVGTRGYVLYTPFD